ncbi:MAG: alpha/beta hydrolase [Deltaproteobacteria bacterium]|nr:alpha/beta hydrolase [Deltaproteobacteria bacterium]
MADPGAPGPLAHRLARRALARSLALRTSLVRKKLPTNDRGQSIDAATYVLLKDLARLDPPNGRRTVGRARNDYEELGPILDRAPRPMKRVEDRRIEGPCTARIFWPTSSAHTPSACCVYFHGGGFVLGSPRSHEGLVRTLVEQTGAVFVSVDYRLAPEHKLPAAHDDALAAYAWTRANASELGIDPERIVLSGDSAGGNLTIATAVSARDAGMAMPCGLVPIYPATDMTRSFPSHRELGRDYFLTTEVLDWFTERFLQSPAQMRDPRVSPLFVTDLSRLPPTHVVTAGFDPLRDEGEAIVTRLRESGVACTHRSEDSLIHGFVSMSGVLPEAERAVGRIADAMAQRMYA